MTSFRERFVTASMKTALRAGKEGKIERKKRKGKEIAEVLNSGFRVYVSSGTFELSRARYRSIRVKYDTNFMSIPNARGN